LNGDKIWLEEGLLVLAKKNKKEELVKKDHPPYPKMKEGLKVSRYHHLMEEYQCFCHLMECADASTGDWGSHATSSSTMHVAQRSIHGASRKQMQVKEGTGAITLQARIHHARPSLSTTER
jgi:hypothetical protein